MKVWRLTPGGGIDGLIQGEEPDPTPGPGEVVVRVRATSLNYRDLGIMRRNEQAIVPLSDGAGEVVAAGDGVRLEVGARVAGIFMPHWIDGEPTPAFQREARGGGATDGMLAELVVTSAESVVRVPDGMSFEAASTLPCAAVTAWNAIEEQARIKPGQSMLLLGTGGVSIFGLQIGVSAGARTIITSSSDAKLERARALGAHETINYRERADWERAVLDLTGGRGVDLVVEVGGAGTYAQSLAATRQNGHVVLIGGLAAAEGASMPMVGRQHVTRIGVGSRRMFEELNRAIEVNAIQPVIDRVFEFGEAREAFRYFESQAHVGKVVVRVQDAGRV